MIFKLQISIETMNARTKLKLMLLFFTRNDPKETSKCDGLKIGANVSMSNSLCSISNVRVCSCPFLPLVFMNSLYDICVCLCLILFFCLYDICACSCPVSLLCFYDISVCSCSVLLLDLYDLC